ncbi:hypothetical protein Btru_059237 [Bulinus truncatus]|nr:hypothetical protein Btru_059237 [Bulinus truncatus]
MYGDVTGQGMEMSKGQGMDILMSRYGHVSGPDCAEAVSGANHESESGVNHLEKGNSHIHSNSNVSQSISTQAPPSKQEMAEDVRNDDDEGGDDYEDEYDEEEEEKVLLEKRVTLSSFENGSWKKLGMDTLFVKYNKDLGKTVDAKKHTCEWKPIDYSTGDPIRKHFCALFSSGPSAQEFAQMFTDSQQLAFESEIYEKVSSDMDVPEIFSGGALH